MKTGSSEAAKHQFYYQSPQLAQIYNFQSKVYRLFDLCVHFLID